MNLSSIGNKLRRRIQEYLGLNEFPTRRLVAALEDANRTRHNELMLRLDTMAIIQERLQRLENMFVSQHVPSRPQAAVYDWEQVQAMALAEMLKDGPPKEDLE